MGRTAHFTEEDLHKAMKLRDDATTVAEFRNALSVILPAILGLDAATVSELLGTSRSTPFRDCNKIRHQGDTPKEAWGGRRRCSLTLEEERAFLAPFEADAGTGGIRPFMWR